ncbi:5-formyltetrahydrofolate cyclo-ligase [Hymenobacter koreensis]|uniref:5-formyltetrahydrofolate cyclo-ligase n=1 Tax=Hymenobacter koreensis TaxID=1084523 RepID=A0ABP8JKJ3_9BACT
MKKNSAVLKADLRRTMLTRRRALSAEELAARGAQVTELLFSSFAVNEWRAVHLFLPIRRQKELDTWPIVHRLWQEFPAVQVGVPVSHTDGRLTHHQLLPHTVLAASKWGIPEPVNAPELLPTAFDAVLVPLLAFDEQGHRVGYGKGFYDRFLLECRPAALRIGMSLEPPVPRIADAWSGDVRLHACITPAGVWHFGNQ